MTAPASRYVDPVEKAAIRLWIRIPRTVIRKLPSMWGVAGDGHALVSFPPVAVLAPVLVTVGAFVVGAQQLGYEDVYTESLLLMVVAVALGAFSCQLGILAVGAFALGEQLFGVDAVTRTYSSGGPFGQGVLATFGRVRLPMIITYLLLAVAVVVIPRTARALVVAAGRWRRVPAALAWPLASVLFTVVVWLALKTWVAAAPTLVRPRFTWTGGLPTVAAIAPIQENGDEIIAAGVMAAMARQLLIGLSMWWPPVRDRVRHAEQDPVPEKVAAEGTRPRVPGAARRLLGDVVAAGLATLVLAGILEEGWLWVATFSVFFGVRLLRSGVVAAGALNAYKRLVAKVPAVVRAIALFVIARVMADALVKGIVESYTAMALVIIGGVILVFFLFPGTPPPEETPPDASPPGASGPVPARAG